MTAKDILKLMRDVAEGKPVTLPPGIWGTLLQEAFYHPHMVQEVEFLVGQPAHDIVVLVSGGLDSSAAYFMAKRRARGEAIPVYCKIRTGYEDLELRALEKLGIDPLILDFSDFTHNRERYGYMIPGRNLLFIMAASELLDKGGEIWLSATEGEIKPRGGDKSWQFWGALNAVLGTRPYPVRVYFPFSGWSKTDIVRWWLKNVNEANILDTLSCQEGKSIHCGACQACFRRWVAFVNNGIAQDEKWLSPPPNLNDPLINKKIREAVRVHCRGYALAHEEISIVAAKDIINALNKSGINAAFVARNGDQ